MNTSASFHSAHYAAQRTSSIKPLITAREREILHLIAYEHSTKEIARKLFISTETVTTHRQNLMRKLKVRNTAGMVRAGMEMQLI